MQKENKKDNHAQSVLEYLLLIGIVTMVLIYMGTDFKRGIQSVVKVTADQMGNQTGAEQDFSLGYMMNSASNTTQTQQHAVQETNGVTTTITGDSSQTTTSSVTNQGFTEQK
ncbi:MAG: hypothetical protein HQL15_10285 [Candidatus Omnitrophica bacterium]|nr:hypothetical protein [Candidatus Omnitrophota bacterium]